MKERFRISAERAAAMVGSHWAFVIASITVAAWAITGPYFRYSDTWQLLINTGTTVVTFLMVFLIQNTQNRETRIVGLKLDELLRGVEGARTGFVNLDSMSRRRTGPRPTGILAAQGQIRPSRRRRPGLCRAGAQRPP